MSTIGFREAYDHSIEVRIADDLHESCILGRTRVDEDCCLGGPTL